VCIYNVYICIKSERDLYIVYGRFGALREERSREKSPGGDGMTVSIYLFIRPVPGEIRSRLKINDTLFELLGIFFSLSLSLSLFLSHTRTRLYILASTSYMLSADRPTDVPRRRESINLPRLFPPRIGTLLVHNMIIYTRAVG